MDAWLTPERQLALSAILPVVLAILILTAEKYGPLAAPIQASKGLVAPYFSSIAVIFGSVRRPAGQRCLAEGHPGSTHPQ
jgi:hypothetical protein